MSGDGLIVVWFLLSLFGCFLIMWTSLVGAKHSVTGWNGNLSARFFFSLGGFGQRQIENWKRWGGYDDDQAETIIKRQVQCWLGMVLWGLVSMAAAMGYKALTHEG